MKPRLLLFVGAGLTGLLLTVLLGFNHFQDSKSKSVSPEAVLKSVSASATSVQGSAASAPALSQSTPVVTPVRNVTAEQARAFTVSPVGKNLTVPGGDPAQVGAWADKPAPGVAQLGEKAVARAQVKDRTFELVPNEAGAFQRVYVPASAAVKVQVTYPEAQAKESVIVRMVDGGTLGGEMARKILLDEKGSMEIAAEVSANNGTHRIILIKGSDVKQLDFWVGPPLAFRSEPLKTTQR